MKEKVVKFFCRNCGSEFSIPENIAEILKDDDCPNGIAPVACSLCNNNNEGNEFWMVQIPEFETVSQWELRKRMKYPNPDYVFVFIKGVWEQAPYSFHKGSKQMMVVATENGPPPNDWRPQNARDVSKEWYCTRFEIAGNCSEFFLCQGRTSHVCGCKHRKWPNPKQFEEEYGSKWLGAVYGWVGGGSDLMCYETDDSGWACFPNVDAYRTYRSNKGMFLRETNKIVCACTLWGKPKIDIISEESEEGD